MGRSYHQRHATLSTPAGTGVSHSGQTQREHLGWMLVPPQGKCRVHNPGRRRRVTDARAHDSQCRSGSRAAEEPMEPLPTQRRLKKEKLVVAVYDVPITGGGMTLVLETDDHALWEFCDVGLGWSRYQTVSSEWHQAEPFQDILPARVTPRPKTTSACQYDIPFGPETTLVVRLAENKRNFIYRSKRKVRARGEALRPS